MNEISGCPEGQLFLVVRNTFVKSFRKSVIAHRLAEVIVVVDRREMVYLMRTYMTQKTPNAGKNDTRYLCGLAIHTFYRIHYNKMK